MIYLINYDRKNIIGRYKPLEEEIKKCGVSWWHHLNNTWLIRSNLMAKEINKRLLKHLYENDAIIVIEIKPTTNYQGWLNDDAWKWIRKTFDDERIDPLNIFSQFNDTI